MKIYFMKENALVYFKGNIPSNLEKYANSSDNKWLVEDYKKYSGEDSPFEEFNFEVKDFQMDTTSEDRLERLDYKNTQILHSVLKNLSPIQATDERLWAGLAHTHLYNYVRKRLKIEKERNQTENKILANFFLSNKKGKRHGLITNLLSKFWWIGHLVYDEKNSNPYEGLEFLNIDFKGRALNLFSNNYTNNPTITRAILKACLEIRNSGINISEDKFREITKYVNILSGVILIDYLSEEELKEKIKKHFHQVNKKRA